MSFDGGIPTGFKQTEIGPLPEDWEARSLKSLASTAANAIVGGPFGSDLVSKDYVPFGVPVIRGQNMRYPHVGGDWAYVSEEKAKSLAANTAQSGDLVFTQRGTLGQVALISDAPFALYLVSQSQMKISLDMRVACPEFLLCFFSSGSGQKMILESAIQTGVPHTNLGILKSYSVPLPPLPEQRAIAESLSDVDGWIAELEALVAKKRDLKQAAAQTLLTGHTRLPGFSGDWREVTLGDVLRVCHGRSQKGVEVESGSIPILGTGGRIGWAREPLHSGPSLLIGRKGTIDKPRYTDKPFWTVDTLFYTEFYEENVPKFFYYKALLIDWLRYNEASGVPSLSAKTIEKIEVKAPFLEEQAAIATVLSDMDTEIEALEAQLAKTRDLKTGMMQDLLTGRVRLTTTGERRAA
ncbi:MAG: restriction endonuclease subunit S [Pseudomonadota bacterium]